MPEARAQRARNGTPVEVRAAKLRPAAMGPSRSGTPADRTTRHHRSCDCAAQQMTVLRDRARQDREMNLTIVVDGDDAHDCPPLAIPGEEHGAGPYASRFAGVRKDGPPQAVVVLIVQISNEIHF